MLNDPKGPGPLELPIAQRDITDIFTEQKFIEHTLNQHEPIGFTPLTSRIMEVHDHVLPQAKRLRQNGEKCLLVLLTGGVPTDEKGCASEKARDDFVTAIEKLGELPVCFVLRLCTEDKEVVAFYQRLDAKFDFSLEVLDDHLAEAQEV